ncbi:MAG: hypothetical protein ACRCSC_08645, partial [Lactococcus garvieae]
MYNLEDLKLKSEEDLQALCKKLKLKVDENSSKDDLISEILVNQARSMIVPKKTDKKERKPKSKEEVAATEIEESPVAETPEAPTEPSPAIEIIPEVSPVDNENKEGGRVRKRIVRTVASETSSLPNLFEPNQDLKTSSRKSSVPEMPIFEPQIEAPSVETEEVISVPDQNTEIDISDIIQETPDISDEDLGILPEEDEITKEQSAEAKRKDEYSRNIKKQFNTLVKEFDGLIDNVGVLEIMSEGSYGF